MSDAQPQAALARRERVIILATDDTGKTTVLTPRNHHGATDEDYLTELRTQMSMYYPQMHYAREVTTFEPMPDMGAPAPAPAPAGKGSVESPVQTLIEFPAEWAR